MDIRQLELFLAVVDESGVTPAARKLNLSPGAVSMQIRNLSSDAGTELFVRVGRRLKPTPAALRLAERARAVVKQMEQIQSDFKDNPRSDSKPFCFGVGSTTLVYRLGGPLRNLRRQFPHCDFNVSVGPSEKIVAGLLDRQMDLGLISLPIGEGQLEITPLYDEELLLIRPSTAPVRGGAIRSIAPEDLEGVPFLLYPKHNNIIRLKIDRFLSEVGVTPRVVLEADDTETIKRLVESGFGYSILPECAVLGQRRFFHVHRIGHKRLIRKQALAAPRSEFPRKLTLAIANFLQTELRDT